MFAKPSQDEQLTAAMHMLNMLTNIATRSTLLNEVELEIIGG